MVIDCFLCCKYCTCQDLKRVWVSPYFRVNNSTQFASFIDVDRRHKISGQRWRIVYYSQLWKETWSLLYRAVSMPTLCSGGRHTSTFQSSSLHKHPWKSSSEQKAVSACLCSQDMEKCERPWKIVPNHAKHVRGFVYLHPDNSMRWVILVSSSL